MMDRGSRDVLFILGLMWADFCQTEVMIRC